MHTVRLLNKIPKAGGGFDVHEVIDHVSDADLDAYLADAALRWAYVEATPELDANPGDENTTPAKENS